MCLHSLDTILDGGLLTGTLVEICGPAVEGKTLLLDALALHFVRRHRVPVLYVSTKNACSPLRWYNLLKAGVGLSNETPPAEDDVVMDKSSDGDENYIRDVEHNCDQRQDIADAMSLLRCESVRTLQELQFILSGLLKSSATSGAHSDWQLLCVDSLTVLLMPFMGQTHKTGKYKNGS